MNQSFNVIGYFAYSQTGQVFCDGDACIIVATEATMRQLLERMPSDTLYIKHHVKKTRFADVREGLKMGGIYALDKNAYRLFSQCYQEEEQHSPLSAVPSYDIAGDDLFFIVHLED